MRVVLHAQVTKFKSNTIFYAKSTSCPSGWHYDHVGFLTTDGKLVQMSGHKYGEGVYVQTRIEEDDNFPSQKLLEIPIGKTIELDFDSSGLQNCGMYVQAQLKKNGISRSLESIYKVMRQGS